MRGTKKPTVAELLLQGAREAAAYAAGEPEMLRKARVTRRPLSVRHVSFRQPARPSADQIRRIRDGLQVSQAVFGELLNVSTATVRAWEQGQRTPDGPSLRLLEIADREPASLLRAAGCETVYARKERTG